jgi:ribose 5-phosphate isomerase B
MPRIIYLAGDHAAVELKAELAGWLRGEGYDVRDLGTNTTDRVDYPDYGYRLAKELVADREAFGIALCGSGIGISIAVNRVPGCRCALVSEPVSAALAREHNDANSIALASRLLGLDMAKACVEAFLGASFQGGRHGPRVDKLAHPPA